MFNRREPIGRVCDTCGSKRYRLAHNSDYDDDDNSNNKHDDDDEGDKMEGARAAVLNGRRSGSLMAQLELASHLFIYTRGKQAHKLQQKDTHSLDTLKSRR